MQNFNLQLFTLLNANTGLHGWPLYLAIFIAKYLVYIVPLWMIILWQWSSRSYRGTLLFSVVAAVVALLLSHVIGLAWFQPRPFMLGLGHTYLTHAPDSTFPSDHVIFIAAIAFSFLTQPGLRRPGILLLIIALCVGWARVFVGVHFPFDILGGFLLAALTVLLLRPSQSFIDRKMNKTTLKASSLRG